MSRLIWGKERGKISNEKEEGAEGSPLRVAIPPSASEMAPDVEKDLADSGAYPASTHHGATNGLPRYAIQWRIASGPLVVHCCVLAG